MAAVRNGASTGEVPDFIINAARIHARAQRGGRTRTFEGSMDAPSQSAADEVHKERDDRKRPTARSRGAKMQRTADGARRTRASNRDEDGRGGREQTLPSKRPLRSGGQSGSTGGRRRQKVETHGSQSMLPRKRSLAEATATLVAIREERRAKCLRPPPRIQFGESHLRGYTS